MPGSSLAETLLIRPGTSLFFSPIEWLRTLGPLPPGVIIAGEFAASTVAVVFVSNVPSVQAFLNRLWLRTVMAVPPVVWLCYPTRGRTDINRASVVDGRCGSLAAGSRRGRGRRHLVRDARSSARPGPPGTRSAVR
jgi:hypothetical protein